MVSTLRGYGIDLRIAAYVERSRPQRAVFEARIRDGLAEDAPIWPDRRTFPAHRFAGRAEAVIAGSRANRSLPLVLARLDAGSSSWKTSQAWLPLTGNRQLHYPTYHGSWPAAGFGSHGARALPGGDPPWPTPLADAASKGSVPSGAMHATVYQACRVADIAPGPRLQLNADWVETLMGWPVGWTDPDRRCAGVCLDGRGVSFQTRSLLHRVWICCTPPRRPAPHRAPAGPSLSLRGGEHPK